MRSRDGHRVCNSGVACAALAPVDVLKLELEILSSPRLRRGAAVPSAVWLCPLWTPCLGAAGCDRPHSCGPLQWHRCVWCLAEALGHCMAQALEERSHALHADTRCHAGTADVGNQLLNTLVGFGVCRWLVGGWMGLRGAVGCWLGLGTALCGALVLDQTDVP